MKLTAKDVMVKEFDTIQADAPIETAVRLDSQRQAQSNRLQNRQYSGYGSFRSSGRRTFYGGYSVSSETAYSALYGRFCQL